MTYSQFMDTTHQVYDLIDRSIAFQGSENQCIAWLQAQDRPEEFEINEKYQGNEESVPSDWWSGPIAPTH